jgi:hypothetical protein
MRIAPISCFLRRLAIFCSAHLRLARSFAPCAIICSLRDHLLLAPIICSLRQSAVLCDDQLLLAPSTAPCTDHLFLAPIICSLHRSSAPCALIGSLRQSAFKTCFQLAIVIFVALVSIIVGKHTVCKSIFLPVVSDTSTTFAIVLAFFVWARAICHFWTTHRFAPPFL